ncbi:MAG: ATP-grasp fold amidoligase family protein [Alphaproteobacteria bacterium]
MQWLKLNCQNSDFWGICSDKLAVREFFEKNFGGEHLIPLLFKTQNWRDISPDNIPNEPCIVKANHGSGWYEIIRNKEDVDYDALQKKCMRWLNSNYYYIGMEPQYKNIEPWIIIEKLLVTKEGKIPNDYKLAFLMENLALFIAP